MFITFYEKSSMAGDNLLWIHKYNGKNDSNLKFVFCTRLERKSLFTLEISSLVALHKYWL